MCIAVDKKLRFVHMDLQVELTVVYVENRDAEAVQCTTIPVHHVWFHYVSQ